MEGYNLKKILQSPFPVRILPYLLLIFALLGFFDASYLSLQHFLNRFPPCTIGGCETVLSSKYAVIGGIPLSLLGAGFYALVALLTGILLQTQNKHVILSLLVLCTAGLVVGIALVLVQAFVLHAFCYYCLFSELIDFLMFDAAWWLWNAYNIQLTED